MKILVTPPFTEEQKRKICSAAVNAGDLRFCLKKDITPDILKEAEVILGNLESPEQLQAAENLKWIQLNNAGTEGYCTPGILPGDALLTNATGAYGLAISEHMMACLFMLRKKTGLILCQPAGMPVEKRRPCWSHTGFNGPCNWPGRYRNLFRRQDESSGLPHHRSKAPRGRQAGGCG